MRAVKSILKLLLTGLVTTLVRVIGQLVIPAGGRMGPLGLCRFPHLLQGGRAQVQKALRSALLSAFLLYGRQSRVSPPAGAAAVHDTP